MKLLAFDPGGTTGWCTFVDGNPREYGQIKFDELMSWLDDITAPDIIVYENFQVYSHKAVHLIGSKLETVQAIGIIKSYAHKNKCKLIEQRPQIKKIAQMWTGVTPPKNHDQSHWIDAYNHGAYYLIKNNVMESQLEIKLKAEKNK